MMNKKIAYTNITPIPSFIPRQLAIDILHAHKEIIELNPLVTGHQGIKAPRDAPADEFYSTWYEISQRIQYIPGMGKLGSGKIKFKGVFHDMPWGLQTHIYAPANVDLRNKWRICGNQPGEPPETRELGLGAPPEGLYLREDIEIKANMTMVGFVKKETKAASKILVERLIKKAELLDSGVLHAMMEGGKLKTINPADRSSHIPGSPQPSPKQTFDLPMSPQRQPTFPAQFAGQMGHFNQMGGQSPQMGQAYPQTQTYNQMQGQLYSQANRQQYLPPQHSQGANNIFMEMEGDSYYLPEKSGNHLQPAPNHFNPDPRYSTTSAMSGHSPSSNDGRWSQANDTTSLSSRPTSYNSEVMRSPGMEQKSFTAELPTTEETREEHTSALKKLEGERPYRYNPQDYANTQNPPPASAHPSQYSQHVQPNDQQHHQPQHVTHGSLGQG